jgi:hypothetical protein
MKHLFFAGIMLVALFFQSCAKSTTDKLIEKPWKVTSLLVMGSDVIPFISPDQPVTLTMTKAGLFDLNLNVTQITGNWTLSADEKKLIVSGEGQTTTWDIVLLEEGALSMTTSLALMQGLPPTPATLNATH